MRRDPALRRRRRYQNSGCCLSLVVLAAEVVAVVLVACVIFGCRTVPKLPPNPLPPLTCATTELIVLPVRRDPVFTWGEFAECMAGPRVQLERGHYLDCLCALYDYDKDGDVDLADAYVRYRL